MKFFNLVGAALFACALASDSSRPARKSIAQTAQDTPQLSSLVDALGKANLIDALSGDGSFTVFAPTNNAFAAIQDTVAGLSVQQLTEVLEYHVIQNVVAKSTDLSNNEKLQPLFLHHELSVDLSSGVQIRGETNTVTVTTADVLCTNGVVHIVDAVLVPNSLRTIVDLAVSTPMLSSLVGALQTANLVDTLNGSGPFTVFAPTNDAFAAISSVVDGLTVDQLTKILEYHVIGGVAAKSTDLFKNEELQPLFAGHGLTARVHQSGCGGICIDTETNRVVVTVADQGCSNGVVHIVNAVLVPRYLSIVETAVAQPELSTLVASLQQADLVDALSGPGPFTVLAPTNDAFAAISSIVEGLTPQALSDVLLYHVLSGELDVNKFGFDDGCSTKKSNCPTHPTLFSGHSIGSRAGGILTETRNRVSFSVRNVKCTNGVVHIVDAVLIPNAAIASIVTTAGFTPTLSSFVGALQQAELVDALSGDGPFTVFAPTDAAFAAISQIVGGLSMEQLVEILEYHVISGVAAKSGDLSNGEVLQPLFSGHSLTVELGKRNSVSIKAEGNTVLVSMANRLCTNGVVHVVDAVLLPNIPLATQNIVEVAQSVPILSELVDAVISADLVDTLSSPGHFTVFAPTNAAFDAISKVVAGLSKRELRDVLLYHVLDQELKSTDLKNGGVLLPLFKGHSLTVDLTDGVKIMTETNSVMVTMADVECTNGVVHIVDAVLIPNRLAVV